MRRKLSPASRPKTGPLDTIASLQPASGTPTLRYREALSRARALGLFGALLVAPLGLAGSVAACGGAAPVQAYPAPPIATIEPPSPQSPAPVGSASTQPTQSE